jgi:hypothetical protein
MTQAKHIKVWLWAGLLLVLLCAHLPILYTHYYHNLTETPTAENGSMDVTGVSPAKGIILDGNWSFYWNRLIADEPGQTGTPDFPIQVPDYWSSYKIDGSYLPSAGFASYRLTVKGLSSTTPMTICLPDFGSAYRVFLDGELAAESGVVSEQSSNVFTTTKAKLYPVTLSGQADHVIILEVATTRFSGLYMAPVLKDYDHAVQENSSRNTVRLILFGMALFAFFVIIVTYALFSRKNRRSFWLPAMGFFVLLRIMLTTEFFSLWQNTVFFGLSYETTNPLMFLVSFIFKYLLIYLLEELMGIAFSRKEKLGFLIYYAALFFVYLLVPHGLYNRHLSVLLPIAAFAIELYAFIKVWFHRRHLTKYGLLIYLGTILAILGLIVDCYYINGNSYLNVSLALLTLFALYMMILSLVSALRTADVYNALAVSTSRLEQAKNQIDMQIEYYNALNQQINEVRTIRHDTHHFVSVITRLSGEGRYEELNRFLGEYADITETEPLPVFCDNVVVNSILGYYALKTKERGIPFHCICAIPKRISVKDHDLCVVLGNALENAIEACERLAKSPPGMIAVEARLSNGQLLIKIENSFHGLLFQTGESYRSLKSSRGHGLGLRSIQTVVASYGGFLKTEHSEKRFILMAAFPAIHLDEPSEMTQEPSK